MKDDQEARKRREELVPERLAWDAHVREVDVVLEAVVASHDGKGDANGAEKDEEDANDDVDAEGDEIDEI